MLNTDLHNPQIPAHKKMKRKIDTQVVYANIDFDNFKYLGEEFVNNNRGINDGQDLPVEYLTNLYEGVIL